MHKLMAIFHHDSPAAAKPTGSLAGMCVKERDDDATVKGWLSSFFGTAKAAPVS